MKKHSVFLLSVMAFGYAFLYLPIVMLIVYSFNDSRISSVWNGFSLRWYEAFFNSEQIIDAGLLSLRIAAISATLATIFGTLAGLALTHMGSFRGRLLFTGLIAAPLVMPEVITGLSLLLVFVSSEQLIGWPENRGTVTIIIAHITFSMAFVAVSKFGVEGLCQVLSDEHSNDKSIRFNCINPGAVQTNMRKEAYPLESPNDLLRPDEIMDKYVWLMSDESKDIDGQSINCQ